MYACNFDLFTCCAGIPQTDMLRIYEGYIASFDMRTRNPKWVLEYISSDTLWGEGTR
jgi:endonuclease G